MSQQGKIIGSKEPKRKSGIKHLPSKGVVYFFAFQFLAGIAIFILFSLVAPLAIAAIGMICMMNAYIYFLSAQHSSKKPDFFAHYSFYKYKAVVILTSAFISSFTLIFFVIALISGIFAGEQTRGGVTYITILYTAISLIALLYLSVRLPKTSELYFAPLFKTFADDLKFAGYGLLAILIGALSSEAFAVSGLLGYSAFIEYSTIFISLILFLSAYIGKVGTAFDILLDRAVSEELQYDALNCAVDFFDSVCELRALNIHLSDKHIFVEYDALIRPDITIFEKCKLESRIENALKVKYPNAVVRLYALPCITDCSNALDNCRAPKYHPNKNE